MMSAMALTRMQTLAAGQILSRMGDDAVELRVDGSAVEDRAKALAAYTDNVDPKKRSSLAKWFDGVAVKVSPKERALPPDEEELRRFARSLRLHSRVQQKMQDSFRGVEEWLAVNTQAQGDLESVSYVAEAEVLTRSGERRQLAEKVEDVRATLALNRVAVAAGAMSFLPEVPMLHVAVTGAMAAAGVIGTAALGAVAGAETLLRGKKRAALAPLTAASLRLSAKLLAITATHLLPFVGDVLPLASMVKDAGDIKERI